jgi:hypothetical protein
MTAQPRCRCCGKAIAKFTVAHYFGASRPDSNSWSVSHTESATTKAEAQRHVNGEIVSVRKGYQGQVYVGVWDGETYRGYASETDFCSIRCAAEFGRMAAALQPELRTREAAERAKRAQP